VQARVRSRHAGASISDGLAAPGDAPDSTVITGCTLRSSAAP